MELLTVDESIATHTTSVSQPCNVRATGNMSPVLYQGQPRNNPDGTFYPGDTFYYLVRFSASSTCIGLQLDPLKSFDGLDVDFHGMVSWKTVNTQRHAGDVFTTIPKNVNFFDGVVVQPHIDLTHRATQVTTHHYYTSDGKTHLFSAKEGQRIEERWKQKCVE